MAGQMAEVKRITAPSVPRKYGGSWRAELGMSLLARGRLIVTAPPAARVAVDVQA